MFIKIQPEIHLHLLNLRHELKNLNQQSIMHTCIVYE